MRSLTPFLYVRWQLFSVIPSSSLCAHSWQASKPRFSFGTGDRLNDATPRLGIVISQVAPTQKHNKKPDQPPFFVLLSHVDLFARPTLLFLETLML